MRVLAMVALMILLSGAGRAQMVTSDPQNRSVTRDMQALGVHVGGRAHVKRAGGRLPIGARSFKHEWPGVYFESAFRGDRVLLKFDDPSNEYRLLIDDLAPIAITQPGRTEVTVTDIGDGAHRVRLEKVTESVDLPASFGGFFVPAGAEPLPIAARTRQIEFIGDSTMSGFGNRSITRDCTPEEVRLTTDTQRAYAALVAKHFDADYQINAVSARGLVRNYAGLAPERVMTAIYPYILSDRFHRYTDRAWQPQLIVIKLNADFVGDLDPAQKWKSFAELGRDYVRGYTDFIAKLQRRSPGAAILITGYGAPWLRDPELTRVLTEGKATISGAAREAGVRSLDFIELENMPLERTACASHYSLTDHRRIAAGLIAYLEGRPDMLKVNLP